MRTIIDTIRRRHATAAAYVALASALGGSAYAVTQVTGADIVDGTITSADIGLQEVKSQDLGAGAVTDGRLATGAVDSTAVRNGTLVGLDVLNGSIRSEDVDLETTVATAQSPLDKQVKTLTVTCPAGMTAMGGGVEVLAESGDQAWVRRHMAVGVSAPTADGTGWTVSASPIWHAPQTTYVFGPTEEGGLHRVRYGEESQPGLAYPHRLRARAVCARL